MSINFKNQVVSKCASLGLFSHPSSTRNSNSVQHRVRKIEILERREMMAANLTATYYENAKSLRIEGTEKADQISVHQIGNALSIGGNIPIATSIGIVFKLNVDRVNHISISGLGGDDTILLNTDTLAGQQPIKIATTIFGGAGNDTIVGGTTKDAIFGEAGIDAIWGNKGFDQIYGGDGIDYLDGGDGDDRIDGGTGDDYLYGGGNRDMLIGGAGNDHLFGNSGEDALIALDGYDYVDGGPNQDRLLTDASSKTSNAGKDATIGFLNGSATWSERDLEILDEGFGLLQSRTNNIRLLRDTNGQQLMLTKESTIPGKANAIGQNSWIGLSHKIQLKDWNEFDVSSNQLMVSAIIHEIGHSWGSSAAMVAAGVSGTPFTQFKNVNWQYTNSGKQAGDFAQYVGSNNTLYGATNEHEDWATMWQSYFGTTGHGNTLKYWKKYAAVDRFFESMTG